MTRTEIAFALFSFFNSIRIFAYVPQFYKIYHDETGGASIALSTWALWAAANASTAFYASTIQGDPAFVLVNAMNTAWCLAILSLATWKRHRHAARFKAKEPAVSPAPEPAVGTAALESAQS